MPTEEYTKPIFIKKSATLIRHSKSENGLKSLYFFLKLGKLKKKNLCIHDVIAKIRRRVAWFAF